MSEMVSHSSDVGPRNVGLAREYRRIDRFHRFPDLHQPSSHGIEHQAVGEFATLEMRADCFAGDDDVRKPDRRIAAHSEIDSLSTLPRRPAFN